MAGSVDDPFAYLRRELARQHRECVHQHAEVESTRAAIRRSRQTLQDIEQNEDRYTKPFAPLPPTEAHRARST